MTDDLFPMAHLLNPDQMAVRAGVRKVCADFDDDYWRERDNAREYPEDFMQAMAATGWQGILMPEEVGGAGLGVSEAAILALTIAESGAGFSGVSPVINAVYGLNPIIVFGNDEQKRRMLPPIIARKDISSFGVTEPTTGLDTTKLKTRAEKRGDTYYVTGQKIWTTNANVATKIMLVARTTPLEEGRRPIDGLSLFFTDLDRRYVQIREIPKMGGKACWSNEVFFDGLPVPEADRIGEEGKGFRYLLHGLNPERIFVSCIALGLGRAALAKAVRYARERVVFDRPIGKNQAIQHPLAESWAELEAALLMVLKAAELYDKGLPCGHMANAAKYLSAEAGFNACTRAVMTHGGMGYAQEFHVERYLREVMVPRLAPVSPQLILCHLAEKVLGLPKSY